MYDLLFHRLPFRATAPPSRRRGGLRRIAVCLTIGLLFTGSVRAQDPDVEPYRELDNIQGPWVNLNHVPIRPMVFGSGFGDLWAVNTHDSTVVHFSGLSAQPDVTYRVPWSPVSIALWTDPNAATDPERLVVVCRGTYGLALLERATGRMVEFYALPAEPGDIAIIGDDAWVSCSGADSVVQIDLTSGTINHEVAIPSEHPLFLTVDGTDVLVTPQFSGNQTVVDKTNQARSRVAERRGILDLSGNLPPFTKLPDNDVIRISSSGTITQTVSGVGTILFGHGINPVTDELWVLNTEANNLGKLDTNFPPGTTDTNLLQSEPSIRGVTVRNRITRVDLAAGTAGPFIELELDGTGAYDDARTIGQPYAIDFVPPGEADAGNAYVVGLLTNRVVVYDSSGTFVTAHDILPTGSIPRAIAIDAPNDRIWVYCWGTNEIQVFTLGGTVVNDVVMDLGFDPTPADIKEGRQLFYDGSHSRHGDESCATCHVEGRMDQLAWDLSNRPQDDKGPLVTQTLSGIERMRPFHWRGEQMVGLVDFNPAFDKLLGGAALSRADFEKFEKFVFSIQSPANPLQDPNRMVHEDFFPPIPSVNPPGFSAGPGNAVLGQDIWFDLATVGNNSCNDCHSLPTATNADVIADGGTSLHQKRSRLMVTGFNALWRKIQDTVLVTIADDQGQPTTRRYPVLGHGFAHSGASATLIEFSRGGVPLNILSDQDVSDLVAFMATLDTGIAPAVHRAAVLDQGHPGNLTFITNYLIDQAEQGNCDVVAFGTSTFGQVVTVRWVYDPVTDLFRSEFGPMSQPLSFFDTQAQAGQGANIFMGVPKGMGERFAVDFDRDGLFNISETRSYGSDPLVADTDSDGFEDGHEVDHGTSPTNPGQVPNDQTPPTLVTSSQEWINARNVKLNFETSEPCTYSIDLASATHTLPTVTGSVLAKSHNVVVNGLLPSTTPVATGPTHVYTGTLTIFDRANNPTVIPLPFDPLEPIETLPFTRGAANTTVVLSALDWVPPIAFQIGGGAVSANASATVRTKFQVPNSPAVSNVVLVARVMILRSGEEVPEVSTTFTSSLRFDTFTHSTGDPVGEFFSGPYLMSTVSTAGGVANFSFGQGGLASGDKVLLVIEGAAEAPATYPATPLDFPDAINRWSLPDTPAGFRSIQLTIP